MLRVGAIRWHVYLCSFNTIAPLLHAILSERSVKYNFGNYLCLSTFSKYVYFWKLDNPCYKDYYQIIPDNLWIIRLLKLLWFVANYSNVNKTIIQRLSKIEKTYFVGFYELPWDFNTFNFHKRTYMISLKIFWVRKLVAIYDVRVKYLRNFEVSAYVGVLEYRWYESILI